MMAVQVQKISDSQCSSAYGSLDPSQFCAGDWNGGKDSCQGDSGGGIYSGTSPSSQQLLGAVSWGQGCAVAGKPGVYASVPYFASWISSQVCSVSGVNTAASPICSGSSSSNTRSTGNPTCSYSSSKTSTFTDSTGVQRTFYCKLMMPTWPNSKKAYCSIPQVASDCEFACHPSCPYAQDP
jgi:secreted trypsin-like serine protease